LGVPLPPPEEKLPEEVEIDISRLVAQAAQKLLQKNHSEAQQQQAQQQMQDPMVQMQMQELELKKAEQQRKAQKDQMDFQIEQERLKVDRERIQSQETQTGATIASRVVAENTNAQTKEKLAGFEASIDIAQ